LNIRNSSTEFVNLVNHAEDKAGQDSRGWAECGGIYKWRFIAFSNKASGGGQAECLAVWQGKQTLFDMWDLDGDGNINFHELALGLR
jgi:hypothetical protein